MALPASSASRTQTVFRHGDGVIDKKIAERLERLLQDFPPTSTEPTLFFGARFDAGLAWVHYPEGCGGLAAHPDQHGLVVQRLDEVGAPSNFPLNPIGLGMVAPTIVHHGTEEQRRRFLRLLYTGKEIWCQLFSEPGAGSDLASLATQAARDGDHWVVNGQKVWTSLGHKARFGLLLARTNVDAPKNRGLTMFLVDMSARGVDVRPLRQMTGDAEFNEVFLDDVRLPATAQLGQEGKGWQVATTTLMNERVSIGGALATMATPAVTAVELYRARGEADPVRRDRVARMWIESVLGRLMTLRAAQLGQTGDPGPVGSVGKLFGAEHARRVHELIMDLLGADGMLYPPFGRDGGPVQRTAPVAFLRSRANTIEGGTSEVMRNILSERVLGLPRDDHGPRDEPWSEIPRN
jgi:alkylation response protein AidB-like acyl-CoA dehydrogenase